MEDNKRHFNPAQLLAFAVFAQQMGIIAGRATGKSGGMTAPFLIQNVLAMPRSAGGLLAPSYANLVEKILPEITIGFERLGFIEGEHYVIGEKPKFKTLAYRFPRKNYSHFISFFNGSGIFMLSGDRAVNNGANLDYLAIEEIRLIKQQKYAELMPTLRGNESFFGKLSNHKSSLFVTDMPKYPNEKWVLELIKEVDNEAITRILQIQKRLQVLYEEYQDEKTLPYRKRQLEKTCKTLEEGLNLFRKKTPFLVKADTLTNIHALGIQTIKNFKRTLSEYDYRTSVLNEEITTNEESFYTAFNPTYEGHAYEAMNYNFTDKLGIQLHKHERDCRWDADLNIHKPLIIGFDYNHLVKPMVVVQIQGNVFKVLNALHVEGKEVDGNKPQTMKDLVKKFCHYYRFHKDKTVRYHFDSSARQGKNADSIIEFHQTIRNTFDELGWQVEIAYHKQASRYKERFDIYIAMMTHSNSGLPYFRYNKSNCEWLEKSMLNTRLRLNSKGEIEKDKREEKNNRLDQRTRPHYSEALDMVVMGELKPYLEYERTDDGYYI